MDIPTDRVRIAFLGVGESKVELVEPTDDTTGVARFLAVEGRGLPPRLLRGPEPRRDAAPPRDRRPRAHRQRAAPRGRGAGRVPPPAGVPRGPRGADRGAGRPVLDEPGVHRGAGPMTDDFATAIDATVAAVGPRLRRVRGDRRLVVPPRGAARSAGTSAAATPRPSQHARGHAASSGHPMVRTSSRTRTGSTASSPTTPTRAPSWRRRCTTRWTRRCRGRRTASRTTGRTTCTSAAPPPRRRWPDPRSADGLGRHEREHQRQLARASPAAGATRRSGPSTRNRRLPRDERVLDERLDPQPGVDEGGDDLAEAVVPAVLGLVADVGVRVRVRAFDRGRPAAPRCSK